MNKLIIFGLINIAFVTVSCERENEFNNSIIGKWEWVMTSHGDYDYPKTPKDVDSIYYIEFANNGSYYLFGNSNEQISKLHYELGNTGQIKTIRYEDYDNSVFTYGYNITEDTLRIWIMNQIYPLTDIYKRIY